MIGAPDRVLDAAGCVVCAGARRSLRAAARAGLRVQGDARIRDGGGGGRRRHEPRLSARHRSAARRAGSRRDAEAPRAADRAGARLSGRRAHRGPAGHDADRDGRARRSRLRRVLAGRRAVARHADAARAHCNTPPRSATASGCARRITIWRSAASRTTAKSRRASACRRFRSPPRRSRYRRSSRLCARRASACTCAGCRRPKASRWCARAKDEGLPITCDVGVHHLHLCDVDIGWFDAQANLMPPLRGTRDRDALRRAAIDGTIDAICSDHTPVDDDGKQVPFAEAEPGATGLELLLPLTLKWASEHRACRSSTRSRASRRGRRGILGVGAAVARRRARRRRVRVRSRGSMDGRRRRRCEARARTRRSSDSSLPGQVRWTLLTGQRRA